MTATARSASAGGTPSCASRRVLAGHQRRGGQPRAATSNLVQTRCRVPRFSQVISTDRSSVSARSTSAAVSPADRGRMASRTPRGSCPGQQPPHHGSDAPVGLARQQLRGEPPGLHVQGRFGWHQHDDTVEPFPGIRGSAPAGDRPPASGRPPAGRLRTRSVRHDDHAVATVLRGRPCGRHPGQRNDAGRTATTPSAMCWM